MRRYGVVIVLAISFVFGVACGSAVAEREAGVSPVVVTIEGSAFSPEVVTVKAGTEVVWKNKDASPHTITADDGSFDSGTLVQGAEFLRKFTKPGIVTYSCDIHAYMSGKVAVKE